MTPISYRYFIRGQWVGPADEKPAVTGAKFLKTLDALSDVYPLFAGWQFTGTWQIPEEHRSSFISLDAGRKRIVEIVESGVDIDDFNRPRPEWGHSVFAVAGARGPSHVSLTASTSRQNFELSFGEFGLATDVSIVTYPVFKDALLAMRSVWGAKWSCAQAFRNNVFTVPIDFRPGVPAFRIDSTVQVPLDPTFPKSVFHVPWIAHLSASLTTGVTLPREILTEHTPDGGLLMTVTEDRLDPTNPEHVRRARILAETLIACTGSQS